MIDSLCVNPVGTEFKGGQRKFPIMASIKPKFLIIIIIIINNKHLIYQLLCSLPF